MSTDSSILQVLKLLEVLSPEIHERLELLLHRWSQGNISVGFGNDSKRIASINRHPADTPNLVCQSKSIG